jgi:hypothetical protein
MPYEISMDCKQGSFFPDGWQPSLTGLWKGLPVIRAQYAKHKSRETTSRELTLQLSEHGKKQVES